MVPLIPAPSALSAGYRLLTETLVAMGLGYAGVDLALMRGLGRLRPKAPRREPAASESLPTVTVLIAARDEEAHLAACLDDLLRQDYPRDRLRIVIADDRSVDATPAILGRYREKYPGLIHGLRVPEHKLPISPKKYALGLAMSLAQGEVILTTDADCRMGPTWVRALAERFDADTGMVLGLTRYSPQGDRPRWIWGTQALEFISYNIVAAALIGLHFPVHGNANNLAYRREAYDRSLGFRDHSHIISGDDDFLLQSIHRQGRWRVRYCVDAGSQVTTAPPADWRQFWEQRKRWASKCALYGRAQVVFLSGIFLYYLLIFLCLALGLLTASPRLVALGLAAFAFKTACDFLVMARGLGLFGQIRLLGWFPFTCLIHIPLILAAVVAGSWGKFTWKGQKVGRVVRTMGPEGN